MMSNYLVRSLGKVTKEVTLFSMKRSLTFPRLTQCAPKNEMGSKNNCPARHSYAAFSTSKTTFGSSSDITKPAETDDVDVTNVTGKKKYWRTYGYDWHDEERDRSDTNFIMFMTITVITVGTSFCLAYFPDMHHKDWSQREAYIEIARREALGLPHVDPNLIAPEKINLPSDEELGDFEIII